ncbi:MAG: hypothetical protein JWO31_3643 [Phycisphaerales bacterium]|nr:hypothetical protein [Phycisphaerales bacterium]
MRMQIQGLATLQIVLAELPKRVESKANRQAVTAALTPIAKAVKAGMPKDTGAARRGVTKKVTARKGSVTGRVGAKRQADKSKRGKARVPSRYLHLIEKGTKAHGRHPGTKGRFVLRDAQELTKAAAEAAAADTYRRVIESAAAAGGRM